MYSKYNTNLQIFIMTDIYKFQLDNLTGEEMTELKKYHHVRFLRTEQKQIHLSHQTDSFEMKKSPD